jgi:hypothetical protein
MHWEVSQAAVLEHLSEPSRTAQVRIINADQVFAAAAWRRNSRGPNAKASGVGVANGNQVHIERAEFNVDSVCGVREYKDAQRIANQSIAVV